MYDTKDEGLFSIVLKIAGCLFAMFLIASMGRACSRNNHNMVGIENGYAYDINTKIIYIESYSGRWGTETTYSPYYSPDGNLYKYDLTSGKWIPINEEVKGDAE